MKANLIKLIAVLALTLVLTSPTQAASTSSHQVAVSHLMTTAMTAAMPLMFIEQQPNRYQVQLNGQSMWFTENEMWLTTKEQNIKFTFQVANPHARIEPINKLETHFSNFKGNDPTKWQTDIPVYSGVRYHGLYPGQDLIITSEQGKLAWQWETVGAGLVPARVADSQTGQAQGLPLPGNVRVEVDNGTTAQTLTLDPHQSLTDQLAAIISPQTQNATTNPHLPKQQATTGLIWSTFLGGAGIDHSTAIAMDSTDNIYLTGYTNSTDFPTTAGVYDTNYNGGSSSYGDVFVAKLNSSGTALIYATFLGGTSDDIGNAIALDKNGNVYITGSTVSTNFPITSGAYDTSYNGGSSSYYGDVFVAKLNDSGTALIYSTFLGGTHDDEGKAIALDNMGNVYITGYGGFDFPTTTGAFDASFNTGEPIDAFVVKLNNNGTALIYSTFLGGSHFDYGEAIALDSNGNVYVTGKTGSTNFPVTSGAYDTSQNEDWDVFITKLNSNGTALIYSTFLGGTSSDEAYAITIDSSYNIYVTGWTRSVNFPTTVGVYDTTHNGIMDIFVTKLNSNGTDLIYSTFLGGSNYDGVNDIILDSAGNIIVTGYTWSTNFPTTIGAFDTSFNGGYTDAFVAKLTSDGTDLSYATFLGGMGNDDEGNAMALDSAGNIIVTGWTNSSNFPTTIGAYDTSYNVGNLDAFVSKLSLVIPPDTTPPSGAITSPNNNTPIGTSKVTIGADVTDPSGIKVVTFSVRYDGKSTLAGVDNTPPYNVTWQAPVNLRSQEVEFSALVADEAGNVAHLSRTNSFVENLDNPKISLNWVPENSRAYLNQRALEPDGDSKCGSASVAMLLASYRVITPDFQTMQDTANAIYPKTLDNGNISLDKVTTELSASVKSLPATATSELVTFNNQDSMWTKLKTTIDQTYPVIIGSLPGAMTKSGHFYVVVGYREEGVNREVIAYDPFGKWTGTLNGYDCNIAHPKTTTCNPNVNGTLNKAEQSRKGAWVYYPYSSIVAKAYLISVVPTAKNLTLTSVPSSAPDLLSDEPENLGVYEGVQIVATRSVYLPLIRK